MTAPIKGRPITPAEVVGLKRSSIPAAVFDGFNAMIASSWDGREATFSMKDAEEAILALDKSLKSDQLYDNGWMDVEPIYRREGWSVEFEKPGYCESGEAMFTFKKRRAR